ncbi:acyltransferase family protein [Actinoplanes sp. NPDC024001]|uniref:acyltransferase n=1 Tax=Actinoplanes sp. NPDC024001 TaxID=3154598 RepID=UPI0033F0F1F7
MIDAPAVSPATPVAAEAPVRKARQWEFDALRVVAISGVVAIHVVGLFLANRELRGTLRWWIAAVIDIGAIWAVPAFVMLSGALVLAPAAHAAGPRAFYRKRFVRILPAMIVWHLIYLFVVRIWLNEQALTVKGVAILVIDARVYTALYFLWLIAGLYLVAPVLVPFLQAGGPRRAYLTAAAILGWTLVVWIIPPVSGLLGVARPITLGAWTMWCSYVGYFVAGYALRNLVLRGRALAAVALLGAVALAEVIWHYGNRGRFPVLDALLPVSAFGAAVATSAICIFLVAAGIGGLWTPAEPVQRVFKQLSDASFGVFLVHLLILALVQRAVPVIKAGDDLTALLIAYAGILVASFAVSMGAARVPYLRSIF